MIIAVDGPAAAGKGTIARALARHYGYHFLDTGSLYRMVAFSGGDSVAAAQKLNPGNFNGADLRGEAVGSRASIISAIPEVRAALLELQRSFARQSPGAVLDGRDIGTIVCPDADAKLFITASPEVRAKRRMLELGETDYETVLAEIRARDARDRTRATAPLVPALDAEVIDTSAMTIDQAVAAAITAVDRLSRK